ncbi:hypothetical protein HMPREF2791_00020 [Corynebacterium sp. HMSC034A01]|nr:hypothetical protein HMPREF2791_00020 [Corynebacterium sp. HMSC034A01]
MVGTTRVWRNFSEYHLPFRTQEIYPDKWRRRIDRYSRGILQYFRGKTGSLITVATSIHIYLLAVREIETEEIPRMLVRIAMNFLDEHWLAIKREYL